MLELLLLYTRFKKYTCKGKSRLTTHLENAHSLPSDNAKQQLATSSSIKTQINCEIVVLHKNMMYFIRCTTIGLKLPRLLSCNFQPIERPRQRQLCSQSIMLGAFRKAFFGAFACFQCALCIDAASFFCRLDDA
jgi:hypothetical protein